MRSERRQLILDFWEFPRPPTNKDTRDEVQCTDCPQKNTIGIWVLIAKEHFMESEKSNQIMKLWLFVYNSVKTPSDLAK